MAEELPNLLEETDVQTEEEVDEPPMYRVILHNDDYTPREFVVQVLMVVFNKSEEAATQLMWHVHKNGSGICGVYTYEVAETKVSAVRNLAREYGFPLRATMEPE
jgi:ATP-dependent Clp protease adaptor protein ClpS